MDELVKMVAKQTGISEDIARKAVDIVLGQLKGKLPAPIGSQLEGIVNGDVDAKDLMKGGGPMDMLKKMFGG